jgi:hypothetical protein
MPSYHVRQCLHRQRQRRRHSPCAGSSIPNACARHRRCAVWPDRTLTNPPLPRGSVQREALRVRRHRIQQQACVAPCTHPARDAAHQPWERRACNLGVTHTSETHVAPVPRRWPRARPRAIGDAVGLSFSRIYGAVGLALLVSTALGNERERKTCPAVNSERYT